MLSSVVSVGSFGSARVAFALVLRFPGGLSGVAGGDLCFWCPAGALVVSWQWLNSALVLWWFSVVSSAGVPPVAWQRPGVRWSPAGCFGCWFFPVRGWPAVFRAGRDALAGYFVSRFSAGAFAIERWMASSMFVRLLVPFVR